MSDLTVLDNQSKNQPLVSILMGAYNCEKYIGEAIQSIVDQTYQNWELIVINDFSQDDTALVVESFHDSRIKFRHAETKGGLPCRVRNMCLQFAQGELVAFLDCDDVYEPNALEDLVAYLAQNPECFCAYGRFREIDSDGNFITNASEFYRGLVSEAVDGSISNDELHSWDNIVYVKIPLMFQCSLIRKSVLDEIRPIHNSIVWDDYYFYLKLFKYNKAGVQRINKLIFRYRVNYNSLTKNRKQFYKLLPNVRLMVKEIFNDVKLHEVDPKYTPSSISAKFYHQDICWMRYTAGLYDQVVQGAIYAFFDFKLSTPDWLRFCFPLMVKSMLPQNFYEILRSLKVKTKPAASRSYL